MPRPNETIGPYTLIRKLGRGAFGVVWLAEKRGQIVTTQVALKIPYNEEVEIDAIRKEASVWLHAGGHPNILPILDADIYDSQPVIVSEYSAEGSLTDWLAVHDGKAPGVEIALRMVDGILAGLEHLHAKTIIHRDLKPDNILLQREVPRLADFGIARLMENTGAYSTNVSGTPKYMAPEAYRGKRSEQTDLWSVGVIAYQLLTGICPFEGEDSVSLMYAVLTQKPTPLPSYFPDDLRNVVSKSLEKDPEVRYRSAAEMRNGILQLIRATAPVAETLGSPAQETTVTTPHSSEDLEETIVSEATKVSSKQLKLEYWTQLNKLLRKHNSVVRLKPAPAHSTITGFLCHPKVEIFATANITVGCLCVGVRIFNRKDIYQSLHEQRQSIEDELERAGHHDVVWRERKNFQTVSEISLCMYQANIRLSDRWSDYLQWQMTTLESFYKAFEPRVRSVIRNAPISPPPLTTKADVVQRFWNGFESRRKEVAPDIQLNKPYIAPRGGGKSWRVKSLGRGFNIAAQLNSTKNYVDVNITVGSRDYSAFAKLQSQQEDIQREIQSNVQWKLNPSGESWVLVRSDFDLANAMVWTATHDWLLEHLRTFYRVFEQRILYLNVSANRQQRASRSSAVAQSKADLVRLLNSVGKSTFVRFYREFADPSLSNQDIAELLPKEFTLKSRQSRTAHARRIFRDGMERQALEIIVNSQADVETTNGARHLLHSSDTNLTI